RRRHTRSKRDWSSDVCSSDLLINNAGVASMNHSLLTPMTTVSKIIQTNFMGTFLLCREAARLMQAHRYGRIVNFATVAVPLKLRSEERRVGKEAKTRCGRGEC